MGEGPGHPPPGRVLALAELLKTDAAQLQRMAGYLPADERSELSPEWQALYAGMHQLTRAELMLLLDRAWEELRGREGLSPPGTL